MLSDIEIANGATVRPDPSRWRPRRSGSTRTPGALRPRQGQGGHRVPHLPRGPTGRTPGAGDRDVADPGRRGKTTTVVGLTDAPRPGPPRRRVPARAVDGPVFGMIGRRRRRRLQPGRADDRHQPQLHRRLRCADRRQQPAGRADRQPRPLRQQRARHRRAHGDLEAGARHQRPRVARDRGRPRRPHQRLPRETGSTSSWPPS